MTLGQGHQKVIQYIFPELYLLCPKYLRWSSNGFDVRSKSHCGGGGRGRGDGNELKDWGDLIIMSLKMTNSRLQPHLPGTSELNHMINSSSSSDVLGLNISYCQMAQGKQNCQQASEFGQNFD